MNKIFNINLGGYPFVIDDDAYKKLNEYLDTIQKHFRKSEGCDEIVGDIEARIAELFNEHAKGQPIVSMRDVEGVIQIMGTPQEFGAEDIDLEEDKKESKRRSGSSTGKRLYRDTDDKVIGGVCSGLAAYFGVSDPLIFRLIFAVLFLSGVGIMAYVLLWIIVPSAKTSADKLSMKGEPINVNNIAKQVEEELNNLSHTITDFAKDISNKNWK
jgi:phage shock protein PspC (stress-responsive transcriptional regulator)